MLFRSHGTKKYYDKWIKTEIDGKCKECGNPTNFISLKNGYHNFCCVDHRIKFSHRKQKENNKKVNSFFILEIMCFKNT